MAQWALHVAAPAVPFAPYSVGDWIVRRTPGGLATEVIDSLGHRAKHLLALATIAGALGLGLLFGRFRPWLLGTVAATASLASAALDPHHPCVAPALAAALVAAGAAATVSCVGQSALSARDGHPHDRDRRQLVRLGLLGVGAAALGLGALRHLAHHVSAALVRADRAATVVNDAPFSAIAGLAPAVSSRAEHYVVDIDLDRPVIPEASWRLDIGGAVSRPQRLSLDDLRAMPTVERLVTLSCISNPVGGPLVGNARWTGVPLTDLLDLARPRIRTGAIAAAAADGYHEWIPLELARQPGTLVAFAMNGSLLPAAHGFPARLIAPGRYGMKNVKWLTSLVITANPAASYWAERGWDSQAVVRTESRIDTPADHQQIRPPFMAAGIAWAGERGITGVEISPDDGKRWLATDLERQGDPLTWRRWRIRLDLPPGLHALRVRATDGTGAVQEPEGRPPHPSGASGYHRVVVIVQS